LLGFALSSQAAASTSSGQAGKPLKIFILAGQSNMEGQATLETLKGIGLDPEAKPLYDKLVDSDGNPRVYEDVHIVAFNGSPDDPRIKQGPLTFGFGGPLRENKVRMGPEFAFGATMYEKLQQPILIIKTAWGGRDLYHHFRSPGAGPIFPDHSKVKPRRTNRGIMSAEEVIARAEEKQNKYYNAMVEHVNKVLADPGKYSPHYDKDAGYKVAGFAWFQGFNDQLQGGMPYYQATEERPQFALYTDLLAHLIRDVRKEFNAPEMPFVIGVMGINGDNVDLYSRDWNFRRAMAATADIPEFKGNVTAVQTAPFWDDRIGEILRIKTILTAPDEGGGRTKAYAELDPEGKYAERRAKFREWYVPMMEREPDRKKDRQAYRAWRQELKEKLDGYVYTPEELRYLEGNHSNAGLHYMGSGKIYSRIGEAFAKALYRYQSAYLLEAAEVGEKDVRLTWRMGETVPVSGRLFRDGEQIAKVDPAACLYDDKNAPQGRLDYRIEFSMPVGSTLTLKTTFPGRPDDFKGELGILDLTANDGINPRTFKAWKVGDPYRLVFVSSEKTDATSKDLATYDAFVTELAEKAGIGGSWKIFASAEDISAKTHTQTRPGEDPDNIPVLLIDGKTLISANYDALWDSDIEAPINRTETGEVITEGMVFGGAAPWGLGNPKRVGLGDPTAHEQKWRWISYGTGSPKDKLRVYAISDVLHVKSN